MLWTVADNQNGNLRWYLPWRVGGSRVPHTYSEKWFFWKPFRIIPWLLKRFLHLVWVSYYVYIVLEVTLNIAKLLAVSGFWTTYVSYEIFCCCMCGFKRACKLPQNRTKREQTKCSLKELKLGNAITKLVFLQTSRNSYKMSPSVSSIHRNPLNCIGWLSPQSPDRRRRNEMMTGKELCIM